MQLTNTALIFAHLEKAGGDRRQVLEYNTEEQQWIETLFPFPRNPLT